MPFVGKYETTRLIVDGLASPGQGAAERAATARSYSAVWLLDDFGTESFDFPSRINTG
jgi:hypothetical protein